MIFSLYGNRVAVTKGEEHQLASEGEMLYVYQPKEALEECVSQGISQTIMQKVLQVKEARFESYEALDIICIPKPEYAGGGFGNNYIYAFFKKDHLIMVCEETKELEEFLENLEREESNLTLDFILYKVFLRLIEEDTKGLEQMETKILKLEDDVLVNKQTNNCVEVIVQFRKRFLNLKRYYERLMAIMGDIIDNENKLFSEEVLRHYKTLDKKINRLKEDSLVLRDYVTQIREAYDAEADIALNKTMQLFTVITAVFLPLTLIVGWYGMNLQMPEYEWAFGYPFIIVISILIILGCIWLFKKKKWF